MDIVEESFEGSPLPEREHARVERGYVESYMLSSLHWSAVRWSQNPALLERGLECYRYLGSRFFDQGRRGFMHLPLSLIIDLMALIDLGDRTPFASEGQAHTWSPEERRVRIDYENLLLGTLLQEPSFIEARERLSSESARRYPAAQRLVELLLHTFSKYYPEWYTLDPAHLRDVAIPPVNDIDPAKHAARFAERTLDTTHIHQGLEQMLHGISNNVYWKEILKSEDLFEIENWAVLDSEATRIGVRQIMEIERKLGEYRLPRVRLQDESMEVDTDFADDTVYPTGGFSGLTNRGSFENMVRSELVYMESGKQISMFDLRFVENELLFYMRNDGVMRRKRRFIHVLLDLDVAFNYKSPGYEYPFSTLTQGIIARLTHDLLEIFEEDAITIQIHYLFKPPKSMTPDTAQRERERIRRELALLSLVLGREVRQERVSLELAEEVGIEELQHGRGRVYALAVVFNKRSEKFWRELFDDLEFERPPVFGVTLPVAVEEPSQEALEGQIPLFLPIDGVSFPEIADVKNELFNRIMSGRR